MSAELTSPSNDESEDISSDSELELPVGVFCVVDDKLTEIEIPLEGLTLGREDATEIEMRMASDEMPVSNVELHHVSLGQVLLKPDLHSGVVTCQRVGRNTPRYLAKEGIVKPVKMAQNVVYNLYNGSVIFLVSGSYKYTVKCPARPCNTPGCIMPRIERRHARGCEAHACSSDRCRGLASRRSDRCDGCESRDLSTEPGSNKVNPILPQGWNHNEQKNQYTRIGPDVYSCWTSHKPGAGSWRCSCCIPKVGNRSFAFVVSANALEEDLPGETSAKGSGEGSEEKDSDDSDDKDSTTGSGDSDSEDKPADPTIPQNLPGGYDSEEDDLPPMPSEDNPQETGSRVLVLFNVVHPKVGIPAVKALIKRLKIPLKHIVVPSTHHLFLAAYHEAFGRGPEGTPIWAPMTRLKFTKNWREGLGKSPPLSRLRPPIHALPPTGIPSIAGELEMHFIQGVEGRVEKAREPHVWDGVWLHHLPSSCVFPGDNINYWYGYSSSVPCIFSCCFGIKKDTAQWPKKLKVFDEQAARESRKQILRWRAYNVMTMHSPINDFPDPSSAPSFIRQALDIDEHILDQNAIFRRAASTEDVTEEST